MYHVMYSHAECLYLHWWYIYTCVLMRIKTISHFCNQPNSLIFDLDMLKMSYGLAIWKNPLRYFFFVYSRKNINFELERYHKIQSSLSHYRCNWWKSRIARLHRDVNAFTKECVQMQWVKNSILFKKKNFFGINIWMFRISDTTELFSFSSSKHAFDIKFVCSRCNSLFQIFIDFFSHKRVYQSKTQWKIQHLEDFRSICNIFYSYEMDKEWDCLVWKKKRRWWKQWGK